MPEEQWDRGTYDMRRRDGSIVGEAYAELVVRIETDDEIITVAEWKTLIGRWMQQPASVQAFHDLIDYCDMCGFSPSELTEFKKAFIKIVAAELKYMFLDKLRDPIAYLAFLTSGRKATMTQRVDPIEALGFS